MQRRTPPGAERGLAPGLWLLVGLWLGLAGCRGAGPGTDAAGLTAVRLQLNWVPEPEFGGLYAAEQQGFFKQARLAVELVKGSAGVPAPQLVASGQVPFGIVSADQVVTLRAQGAPLVALFAAFQTSPRALAVHAASPHQTLEALWQSDARLALEPGLPFARWLAHRYGARGGQVVPANGGLAGFVGDPTLGQAVYAFAEPVELEARGVAARVLPVAASGYDPYEVVLATNERFLAEHPAVVAALVKAVRQGYAAYLADPGPANAVMAPLNPAMSRAAMDRSAALARPYLLGLAPSALGGVPEAAGAGALSADQVAALGRMTEARWQTLIEQLTIVGALEAGKAPKASDCFRNLP